LALREYIESGIIESYVLGFATAEEAAELLHLRKLYPELDTEISFVEARVERAVFADAVLPPVELKGTIIKPPGWSNFNAPPNGPDHNTAHTYINIQPQPNNYMRVSIWWRCAFIALCMLVMGLVASNYYFYTKYKQMEDMLLHQKNGPTDREKDTPK
jgi:hypothetical protein